MDMTIDLFTRYILGAYFTFIAIFYSVKLVMNRTGKPITFLGKVGTAHWLGHITFRIFRLAIWWVCLARIFYPQVDSYIGTFEPLMSSVINLIGLVLIVAGFGLIFTCHKVLKQHWRLGIDESGPEKLVTTGIYSKSRNPIFLGVLIGQFGFFLALPSIFSLVCLALGVLSVISQVKLEEEHLQNSLKDRYQSYCKTVPRYF